MPAPPCPAMNSGYSLPNTMYADSPKAPVTAAIATVWMAPFDNQRPNTRLISAPISGRTGIHARIGRGPKNWIGWSMWVPGECQVNDRPLVPEGVQAIDLDVAPAAEHRDDDRQAHRGL